MQNEASFKNEFERSFYYEKYYKFVVNNDNIYLKGYEIKLGELEIVYSLSSTRK